MEALKFLVSKAPELKLLALEKLKATVKTRFPELYKTIPASVYKEYIRKQEIHQIHQQVPKKKNIQYMRIAGTPYSFQIDIMCYSTGESIMNKALLCIDTLSRKLFTYPLTPNASMQSVLEQYKVFVQEAKDAMDPTLLDTHPLMRRVAQVTGDAFFDNKAFLEYNTSLFIGVKTTVAKDNHFHGHLSGNPLGIVDRVTRTLKALIGKIQTKDSTVGFVDALKSATQIYNSTVHRSLYGKTPNDFYANIQMCKDLREAYLRYNDAVAKKQDIPVGTRVRAVQQKHQFQKEKPPYTRTIYTVWKKEGFRYVLKDESGNEIKRRYNFHELFVLPITPVVEKEKETGDDMVRISVITVEDDDDDDDVPALEDIPKETQVDAAASMERPQGIQDIQGIQEPAVDNTHDQISTSGAALGASKPPQSMGAVSTHQVVSSRIEAHEQILPRVRSSAKSAAKSKSKPKKQPHGKPKGTSTPRRKSERIEMPSAPQWVTNVYHKPSRPSPEERKEMRENRVPLVGTKRKTRE